MPAALHSPDVAAARPANRAEAAPWLTSRTAHGAIALALAVAASAFSFHLSGSLGTELFEPYAGDVWFQADLPRVVANMTDAASSHYRNKVHPIASLVVYPIAHLLLALHPMSALMAARATAALSAGAWTLVLYALMAALGLPAAAAIAFVLLAMSSGAFVMFFAVPELYQLGSLSMMAVLLGAALAVRRGIGGRAVFGLGLASLAMTTTNWMAGIALAFTHLPWRRAVRCCAWVLGIAILLALVQKLLFPTSGLFFLFPSGETQYVGRKEAGLVWNKLAGLLLHPFVVPDLVRLPPAKELLWPLLSVQSSMPGGSRGTGVAALVIWAALLGAGIAGARRLVPTHRRFLLVLFGTLAGQVALHVVYGEETFLYSLHLLPFLVTVAALSWFSRWRSLVIPAVLLASVLALSNNLRAFSEAGQHVEQSLTERERLKRAMKARPDAAWPRNEGHVVLGGPGTPLSRKGFQEPGGSFSPAPGSFGVSVWVTDAQGRRIATSDTMPLPQVSQSLAAVPGSAVPALVTGTRYYRARWSWERGDFVLDLQPARADAQQRLWVLLRSVGPAGAPLRSIRRDSGRLVLNNQWEVAAAGAADALIGDEAVAAIDLRQGGVQTVSHALTARAPAGAGDGWLFAALPVGERGVRMRVRDLSGAGGESLPASPAYWSPSVPDERFAAMAQAQQAHLLMGLTDSGTRPGEPVSYDSEWARDGAYVIAALARAGQGATVEQLAKPFAERDFFGGFGAEADAPGFAIWALAEASRAVADPRFDAWAWPHVRRKAGWILACLQAARTVEAEAAGRVLPAYREDPLARRPCEAAQGGLAMGHMDQHYPVLFVNAVNYLGLREAAGFARRVGETRGASALEEKAQALALAWRHKFTGTPREAAKDLLAQAPALAVGLARQQPGFKRRVLDWLHAADDDRTYAAALWPSGVLGQDPAAVAAFEARLQQRWQRERDGRGQFLQAPKWTYFSFAEAHQWLALGRPERAWPTLDYFMRTSSSPGLYTWWEEGTEENASYRWTAVRGWTDPQRITPHYWSAAEALMLQMAMLVRVDDASPEAGIVIGAGVPAGWLSHRIDSGTILTRYGPVRWVWDAGRLLVDAPRAAPRVRAAPVFGNAEVIVRNELPPGRVAQVASGGTGSPREAAGEER
ncbi:hypothetical protein [Ramlibacter humi]|uniref:hypothetical protein n=1 Tax=Ramlibacter humi TaxID=2530451 RepID=UPI0014311E84|nr:hypothetical protein [Ramlibacter humi]